MYGNKSTRKLAALALIVGAVSLAGVPAQGVELPEMTPKLNLGKMNYDHFCAKCHGANGVGTDTGPTFLHRVYHPGHHGDAAFFRAAKQGVRAHHWRFGDMKPVAGITDQQLKTIVTYVRALQKANGVF